MFTCMDKRNFIILAGTKPLVSQKHEQGTNARSISQLLLPSTASTEKPPKCTSTFRLFHHHNFFKADEECVRNAAVPNAPLNEQVKQLLSSIKMILIFNPYDRYSPQVKNGPVRRPWLHRLLNALHVNKGARKLTGPESLLMARG